MANGNGLGTILVLVTGVLIAALALLLSALGFGETAQAMAILFAPTSALAFGLLGMNLFGRDGLVKTDRFVSMNIWLALGLVILTLAEIAGIVMALAGSPEQVCFTVGLVQMPGLLLWGLGIIGYLKSVNQSLDLIEEERLWPILVFVAVMGSLMLVAAAIVGFPERSPLSVLVSAPTVVWLVIVLSIVFGLLAYFRNGMIARPLALLFLALVIYFVRSALWVLGGYCQGYLLDDILSIEAYLLIGASLMEAARFERG